LQGDWARRPEDIIEKRHRWKSNDIFDALEWKIFPVPVEDPVCKFAAVFCSDMGNGQVDDPTKFTNHSSYGICGYAGFGSGACICWIRLQGEMKKMTQIMETGCAIQSLFSLNLFRCLSLVKYACNGLNDWYLAPYVIA
jgi:hypothetical protein